MEPFAGAADASDVKDLLPHLRLVEGLLEVLRGVFSESLLGSVDRLAKVVGNLAYCGVAILAFIFFIILGFRSNSLATFFMALAVIPIAILLQYAAVMFLDAGTTLIEKSPSTMSSTAFLNCFGLVSVISALGALVFGIVNAIGQGGLPALAIGLGWFLVLLYAGGVALTPSSVNVAVGGEASAGEEAISILSFVMKLIFLRLVPFAFGVASAVGVIFLAYLIIQLFGQGGMFMAAMAVPACGGVLAVALLPFVAYVLFLLYYLGIDVLRAVLVVPGKLDDVARQLERGHGE